MTVIDITKPKSSPKHTMSILRNEPGDFEAYCPECGKHIFIRGSKMIVESNGDWEAKHIYPVCSDQFGTQILDLG